MCARRLRHYLEAVEAGTPAPAEMEELSAEERAQERVMLGLRLDRPLVVNGLADQLDPEQVDRLERAGLLSKGDGTLVLSERGRFVANSVIATILR